MPYIPGNSFDSSGSGRGYLPLMPPLEAPPTFVCYPYGGYYHGYSPWHTTVAPVQYIRDIQPGDVLCGRGGATNSHSGNRAFRSLVKQYQPAYLKAKKREKPAVASIVVDIIRKKGGRFLRRSNTDSQGSVLWVDIGDERAREKTCQALREGAPDIRRRQKVGEHSDDSVETGSEEAPELVQSFSNNISTKRSKRNVPWTGENDHGFGGDSEIHSQADGPIVIRPVSKLFQCQENIDPIQLDQLSTEEREMYLTDFLPPCPQVNLYRHSFQ